MTVIRGTESKPTSKQKLHQLCEINRTKSSKVRFVIERIEGVRPCGMNITNGTEKPRFREDRLNSSIPKIVHL